MTVSGVFPDEPQKWGYYARTDSKNNVLDKTQWFRIPYPGMSDKKYTYTPIHKNNIILYYNKDNTYIT